MSTKEQNYFQITAKYKIDSKLLFEVSLKEDNRQIVGGAGGRAHPPQGPNQTYNNWRE